MRLYNADCEERLRADGASIRTGRMRSAPSRLKEIARCRPNSVQLEPALHLRPTRRTGSSVRSTLRVTRAFPPPSPPASPMFAAPQLQSGSGSDAGAGSPIGMGHGSLRGPRHFCRAEEPVGVGVDGAVHARHRCLEEWSWTKDRETHSLCPGRAGETVAKGPFSGAGVRRLRPAIA